MRTLRPSILRSRALARTGILAALILSPTLGLPGSAGGFVPPRAAAEGERAMILLSTTTPEACRAVEEEVRSEGGRVAFVFRPSLVVAFLPREGAARLASRPEVLDVRYRPADPAAYGPLNREQAASLEIWNRLYMGLGERHEAPFDDGEPGPGRDYACGLPVPEEYRTAEDSGSLRSKGYGATTNSTSEYMLLDGPASRYAEFHVKFVFPESDGTIDASTEDWAQADMTTMLVECLEGIEWWGARYAPARWSVVASTTWQVNTSWEPINHPHTFESTWINQIMNSLGYGGANYFAKVRNFDNNYLVAADEAWFATIFVVNSKNDVHPNDPSQDHRFTDGWFDYSYYGGPFLVMTWGSGPWGNANTDYLTAHEIGHTFYALDEYGTSGCSDTQTSGYLNVQNGNCENGGGVSVECIMRNNTRNEFTNGSVCSYSRNSIGWRDTDADSIPDILDHPPILALDDQPLLLTCGVSPAFTGTVVPEVEPNVNPLDGSSTDTGSSSGDSISVNSVTGVEYRVDGGAWLAATPDDGVWDEAQESFTFFPALSVGAAHRVEARATNSRGLVSAIASDSVLIRQGFAWSDDIEDGDVSDWTINSVGVTVEPDSAVAHAGTWSLKVAGSSASGEGANAFSPTLAGASLPFADTNEPYTISFWFRWSSFHWARLILFGHVRIIIDQSWLPIKYDPNGNWTGLTSLGGAFSGYIPPDTWKKVVILVDPAARQYTVTMGGSLLGTASYNASVVPSTELSFADHYSATDYLNAWYDDFHVDGCTADPTAIADPGWSGDGGAIRMTAAPNPFGLSTRISFEIPRAGEAALDVYDVRGALVRNLLRGPRPAGTGTVRWDGRDEAGRPVAAGIYFLNLTTQDRRKLGRVVLLR